MTNVQQKAFTLAELLIALVILGVIATFTIPKLLIAQQSNQKTAIAKEAAAAVAQAWYEYKQDYATTGTTKLSVLEPYLNYVAKYTTGAHGDMAVGEGDMLCANNEPCYQLASGAVIQFLDEDFGGTSSLNACAFDVDPDGEPSGLTTGDGKGVEFSLYYNGRLATWGTVAAGTQYSGGAYNACPACDPTWFQW